VIVKLAGNNGSGKTTLIRELTQLWNFTPVLIQPGKLKVLEYVARVKPGEPLHGKFNRVVVLGDYRNVCGGMDTVADKDVRYAMVEKWNRDKKALVFFEGILMGETYGALGALSDVGTVPWVYAFMSTSFDECVRRVIQRRTAKGNFKLFDPERSMRHRVRRYASVARRAEEAGHFIYEVERTTPEKAAKALIKYIGGKS
jgi:energy-coupling factor transporter ATP-binding protein EcfA2